MAPKLPKTKEEKAKAYLQAMLEVKARLKVIEDMRTSNWPHKLRVEVCYLQLRHICELVTVGALIIQGDYSGALGDRYQPGPIFKDLDRRYGMGFPKPMSISKQDKKTSVRLNSVPGAMTNNEMIALWNIAGDKLHRLKISKFFSSYDESVDDDIAQIASYKRKLELLLTMHAVPMHTPKCLVLVSLNAHGVNPQSTFLTYGDGQSMSAHIFDIKGTSHFFG
jgi:hypothetical protein